MNRKSRYKGYIGKYPVFYDGFDGKMFQGWRDRIRRGENLNKVYIPSDDRRHIIKIYQIIRAGKIIMIDTQYGKSSIDDPLIWDLTRIKDIGKPGRSHKWIHDERSKKHFAYAFLAKDCDFHQAFKLAYGRVLPTRQYEKVQEILMNDEVVLEEIRQNLRHFYKQKKFDPEKVVTEKIALFNAVKAKCEDNLNWYKYRGELLESILHDQIETSAMPDTPLLSAAGGNNKGVPEGEAGIISGILTNNPEVAKLFQKKIGERLKEENEVAEQS
jgi:hypothetical protein